ncbi:hypothetical protein [Streptococcus ferus]|uniref:hypothetical protein n=1 Tax=Streptococcus ferus TaxID=1345 RepID=UPI002357D021|nr:hypothetical protein [Streptococcus ferus]
MVYYEDIRRFVLIREKEGVPMRKRLSLLLVLFLGGIVIMTGCRENKNSRQWIENKVSAVSRVYPTEDLFDLFKEFPEGFEIRSVEQYKENGKSYSNRIKLIGDPSVKKISGKLTKVLKESDPYRETTLMESDVTYTEDKLNFLNPDVSNEILNYNGFLFQKLSLNKDVLANLKLKSKAYSWETGDVDISYYITDSVINEYLHEDTNQEVALWIDFNRDALIGYQFGFAVSFKGAKSDYTETIVSQKINEGALKNAE